MEKDFETLLEALFDQEEKTLIRAEIKYGTFRLHITCGTNPEAVKKIKNEYGVEKEELSKLIEKHLAQPLESLTEELKKIMIKHVEEKFSSRCRALKIDINKTEGEE